MRNNIPIVASAEAHEGRETPGSSDTADYSIVVRRYEEVPPRHSVMIKYSSQKEDGVSVDISVFKVVDGSADLPTEIRNLANIPPGIMFVELVAEIVEKLR